VCQVVADDEQKLVELCVRTQRVQNTDELVVTKAKKMGKELFAELQPDARKKMLDSIVRIPVPSGRGDSVIRTPSQNVHCRLHSD